jgi:hypothetical protein
MVNLNSLLFGVTVIDSLRLQFVMNPNSFSLSNDKHIFEESRF